MEMKREYQDSCQIPKCLKHFHFQSDSLVSSYFSDFLFLPYCEFEYVQVIKRVRVRVDSAEDVWALKFLNFIVGANQLLFDGLTRELPL